MTRLVEYHISAGVHGLWILGTTARFDLIPDDAQRRIAEAAAVAAAGRVPTVLNVSDMGTRRTILRAKLFADLPYDYFAALPPWYQPMTAAEVTDFYLALADELPRPVVIYNAPWICNQLSFDHLRRLAEHPRIVGCKDVSPSLARTLEWTPAERRRLGFSYLHGNDLLALSTEMGADGFVVSISDPFPELAVAIWDAVQADDAERAFRLQAQLCRLCGAMVHGTYLACLEAALRHRGLLERMLPKPLRPLDEPAARRVAATLDEVGVLPDGVPAPV
jgi:4-hydroxy-tetrahydrodipicolinate synthase